MKNKTVCVIGLGYIGLPTAALLASKGYDVIGVDLNRNVVETINKGQVHIVEPDLDAFVWSAVAAGKLRASTELQPADIYIICVPTPFNDGEGIPQPNLDYIWAATNGIAHLVKPNNLVILESTSPVGTTEKMSDTLKSAGVDITKVSIAYCPERVLPGNIMTELIENDRIVGGLTSEASQVVADFYRTFVQGEVFETESKTAEMCKLTENSFRDVNIAFANELSMICAKEGINVWRLIQLANRHPRVNVLQPSAGVGGHCIAVDPWFIVARDHENTRLIRSAREINNFKTTWAIDQIKIAAENASAHIGRKPKVACLGLAFKPDIDDLRESPSVHIAESLIRQGYDVMAVEPNIDKHESVTLATLEAALAQADVIAVLVKHRQFANDLVRTQLQTTNALDFCGLLG
jgi:UDP-N-acetyl-D-mannosaminuronic acid dehydrogenase